jgi:predicted nucleic acid-binding protein
LGTLIDSSVFIAAERGHRPTGTMLALTDLAGGEYLIAAITASELLHGIYRAKTEQQRLARTADVENILSTVLVIPFDLAVARLHAQLTRACEPWATRWAPTTSRSPPPPSLTATTS